MTIPKRHTPRADNGLFGPSSLTWEVMGHPISVIGASRSAVYTALGSAVAQAVCDHSIFFDDPLTRTQETAYWSYTSVFGDTEEARRAGKWVQGKHAKVVGYDPVSRSDYSPSRPDLAIAGHCLIWDSNLAAFETYVRRLSDSERDIYWREGFLAAQLLDIELSTLPQTWDQWRHYYQTHIAPALNYSAAGNRIIISTKAARFAPAWARPLVKAGVWLSQELTLATLSPTERQVFGNPRSAARTALTRQLGALLATLLNTPPLRHPLERSLGGNAHELLTEARRIQREHTAPALTQPA
jgi:uncharacterized protein (DUF2236 family)